MCGFAGFWNFDDRSADSGVLVKMLELQAHRGPDDKGMLACNPATGKLTPLAATDKLAPDQGDDLLFGFNRLSIQDVSINGHQPMIGSTGKVALMMNGEIYNAGDHRADLEAKGYRFRSRTDTEVALYLYEEYGISGMLKKLNGMFAFAIADMRSRKLLLVRDRFGIKPLYVLAQQGRIAFASELKSFGVLPGFRYTLNESGLHEFMLFRNVINQTLFRAITNLTPGTYREIGMDGIQREHVYYDVVTEGVGGNVDDPVRFLEENLAESVDRQMVSDVKLGCQLSGGVDSSLVTSLARRCLQEGQLETVSVVFDDDRFTEKAYVDQVAGKLGLKSHQFTLRSEYYLDVMEKATWHFEHPLNHPNTIGIYLLSQEARKHVTVLLSGEGADETLAGYSRFLDDVLPVYRGRHFLSNLRQYRNELPRFFSWYSSSDRRMMMSSAFGHPSDIASVMPDFRFKAAFHQRESLLAGIPAKDTNRRRKYEVLTYLPDLLMRQDKMSMAHSIENRVPFLDNQAVEAAFRISSRQLIVRERGEWHTKKPLKDLAASVFGHSFAYRPKMGFGIPVRTFLKDGRFLEEFRDRLLPGIRNRGLFDGDTLERWATRIDSISGSQLDCLWLVQGFERWAQQYLDR